MFRSVLGVALFWCALTANGEGAHQYGGLPMGMSSSMDYNLQGTVCNNRYCSYRRYGLHWAMNTTGESIVWDHKNTRFIKIGFALLNEDKDKNIIQSMFAKLKNEANPLAMRKGYYFKYCDAANQTCEYLGDRQYHTMADLEKLLLPVMEVRQNFPVDIAGKMIDRRNKILLTFGGMIGGFYITKLTITGVVSAAANGLIQTLKVISGNKANVESLRSAFSKLTPSPEDSGRLRRINHLLPRIAGIALIGFSLWHNIAAWDMFSPASFVADYYAKNVKMPLFMAVPDMFVTTRREKVSIETLRDAFDMTLKGGLSEFIAAYKEKQPVQVEDDGDN